MAKYLDENGLLYFWQQLKTLFAGKVDVVNGKGLSTNDYTTNEKNKLAGIETGAEVNVLEGVTVNGTAATITNKIAAISTPTKTSDLTNDSGYITSADVPEGAAASTTTPKMDGTASTGSETAFARGDHIHPTDTSRQAKITASGILKGDGSGGVSAAVAGTDYQAPLPAQTGNSGKFLTTNGSALSWGSVDAFPSQSGKSGKFLTTNGSAVSWADIPSDSTKAPLASPAFTGTPTAPTPSAGDDSTKIATTAFVQDEIDGLSSTYLTQTDANTTYAKKTDITNVYKYKGSVAAYADLPASGNTAGDVYNVEATGMNYAWTGTAWDALGEVFTITSISNAEIDVIMAA